MASSLDEKEWKDQEKETAGETITAADGKNISYHLLLGGEGAMWTENVDQHNFECRVWPRASAIAYRLWGFGQYFCHLNEQQKINTVSSDMNMNLKPIAPCAKYYFDDTSSMSASTSNGNKQQSRTTTLYRQIYPLPLLPSQDTINNSTTLKSNSHDRLESKIRVGNGQLSDYYELSRNATQLLYSAYVIHRYYLTEALGLEASTLTFHYPDLKNTHSTAYFSRRKNQVSSNNGGGAVSQYGGVVKSIHHQTNVPLGFFPIEPKSLQDSLG